MYNKYEIKTYTDSIKNDISDLAIDKKKISTNNNINNNTDIEKDNNLKVTNQPKISFTKENNNVVFYQSSRDSYKNVKNKKNFTPSGNKKKISNNNVQQLSISNPQQFEEENFSYNYTSINKDANNRNSNKIIKINNNTNTQRINLNEKINQRNKKQRTLINPHKKQIDVNKSDNFKVMSYRPIEYDSDINYNLNNNRPKLVQIYKKQGVDEISFPSKRTFSPLQKRYQSNTLKYQSFFGSFNGTKNSKSTTKIKNQLNDFNIDKLIEIGEKYINLCKPVLPLGETMNNNILNYNNRIKSNKNIIPNKKKDNYYYINKEVNQFDNRSNYNQKIINKDLNNDIQINKSCNIFKEKKRVTKKIVSKTNLKSSMNLNVEDNINDNQDIEYDKYDNTIKKNLNMNTELKDIKRKSIKTKKNSLKNISIEKPNIYNLDGNKHDDGKQNMKEISQNQNIYQKKSNMVLNQKESNINNTNEVNEVYNQKNQKLKNNIDNNKRNDSQIVKKNIQIDDESNYSNNNLYNKKKVIQNKDFSITDKKKYNKNVSKVYYKDTKPKTYYGFDERHNLENTIDNHSYFESVHSKKV